MEEKRIACAIKHVDYNWGRSVYFFSPESFALFEAGYGKGHRAVFREDVKILSIEEEGLFDPEFLSEMHTEARLDITQEAFEVLRGYQREKRYNSQTPEQVLCGFAGSNWLGGFCSAQSVLWRHGMRPADHFLIDQTPGDRWVSQIIILGEGENATLVLGKWHVVERMAEEIRKKSNRIRGPYLYGAARNLPACRDELFQKGEVFQIPGTVDDPDGEEEEFSFPEVDHVSGCSCKK